MKMEQDPKYVDLFLSCDKTIKLISFSRIFITIIIILYFMKFYLLKTFCI